MTLSNQPDTMFSEDNFIHLYPPGFTLLTAFSVAVWRVSAHVASNYVE